MGDQKGKREREKRVEFIVYMIIKFETQQFLLQVSLQQEFHVVQSRADSTRMEGRDKVLPLYFSFHIDFILSRTPCQPIKVLKLCQAENHTGNTSWNETMVIFNNEYVKQYFKADIGTCTAHGIPTQPKYPWSSSKENETVSTFIFCWHS